MRTLLMTSEIGWLTSLMLFKAINISETKLPAWVQPVTTVKSHGVPGVSLNASLVFSQIGAREKGT